MAIAVGADAEAREAVVAPPVPGSGRRRAGHGGRAFPATAPAAIANVWDVVELAATLSVTFPHLKTIVINSVGDEFVGKMYV